METPCRNVLSFALLATLLPGISGIPYSFHKIQKLSNTGLAEKPLADWILREGRDAKQEQEEDEVDEDLMMNTTHVLEMSCVDFYACRSTNRQTLVARTASQMDLKATLAQLPENCSESPGCSVSDDCADEAASKLAYFTGHLYQLTCDSRANLKAGEACWEAPFNARLLECVARHEPDGYYTPTVTAMMACVKRVPQGIATCQPSDVTFFDSFTDDLLALVRLVYAETAV